MPRIDTRLERALLAIAMATGTLLLVMAGNGESILSGELFPIAVAMGVAVYAGEGSGCCG